MGVFQSLERLKQGLQRLDMLTKRFRDECITANQRFEYMCVSTMFLRDVGKINTL